jgi:hypothetical protein
MRPVRTKKAAPKGVFPKRFLISTLRRLGQEVGFTLPTLAAPGNGAGGGRPLTLRVQVYRAGRPAHRIEVTPEARQSCVEVWQPQWEAGLGGGSNDEDLISVEYLYGPEDEAWLGPAMSQDVEGQFLARDAGSGRYSTVLTSMVPFRPEGYTFTPIIGLTHYHKFGPEWENYALFVNCKGAGDAADGGNPMHADYYSFAGARLAASDFIVPFNSGFLLPIEATLAQLGVPAEALAGGVISHCRGGASQFSIFTLIRNKRSGAVGLEHSLPPYYYVTGISHPAIRVPFYQRALAPA